MRKTLITTLATLTALVLVAAVPLASQASHAWGSYHWARSSNPVAIPVIDSMTGAWDANLQEAIADWDTPVGPYPDVLTVRYEPGNSSSKTRQRCRAAEGKVRSCNAAYGYNGWLGLAQIWVSGGHIVQAVAKMNDSYLSAYDDTARQHVICQEIGHAWGLGHQSESGADLHTCMDYALALDNRAPNAHDFEQLALIYMPHTDTIAETPKRGRGNNRNERAFLKANLGAKSKWGKKIHGSNKGNSATFVRGFGRGLKVYTHVTWAR